MKHFLLSSLILLFLNPAQAFSLKSYGLGYGLLNSGLFTESVSSDGQTSPLGSFAFHFLTATAVWQGGANTYRLRGGYTIIPRGTADDAADISQWLLSGHVGIPLGTMGNWVWNTGMGVLVTKSKGRGGSLTLNNGGGSATFFRPSNTVEAHTLNLETGFTYKLSPSVEMATELLLNGLFSEKRNAHIYFSISYMWGEQGAFAQEAPRGGSY